MFGIKKTTYRFKPKQLVIKWEKRVNCSERSETEREPFENNRSATIKLFANFY